MLWTNHLKTAVLLGALMGLCMLVGHLMGGSQGLLIGLILGGVGNLVAFFFSDRLALTAMQAHEIQRQDLPWLHDMIAQLAERAGLPMPRVYVCPQPAPNAFATGRSPRKAAVAITQGMLQSFPRDEIQAVMAHEIAHIKHRDTLITTIAATLAGMLSYVGYMLYMPRDRDAGPLGAIGMLAMIILAPLAAALIQMAISRSREYAADYRGGQLAGDPLKLARALERLSAGNQRIPTDTNPAFHSLYICEPLHSGITHMLSTHPPIEKRIAALQRQAMQMR